MNIGALLPRHARFRGDHIALVVGGRRLTYRRLNAEVNRLANALLAAGLRKADKFTTILPNCLELMVAYWAAAKTGIVIVPASPLLQDAGLATLITDLERQKRLDKTLIVVATEFGRPPEFDGGGGRGHHSKAFSIVLAGGGLKTGQVVGVTDDFGRNVVSRPVSIPDLHATIYAAMGVNPSKELYDGDRPVPITDRGNPLTEVFS